MDRHQIPYVRIIPEDILPRPMGDHIKLESGGHPDIPDHGRLEDTVSQSESVLVIRRFDIEEPPGQGQIQAIRVDNPENPIESMESSYLDSSLSGLGDRDITRHIDESPKVMSCPIIRHN